MFIHLFVLREAGFECSLNDDESLSFYLQQFSWIRSLVEHYRYSAAWVQLFLVSEDSEVFPGDFSLTVYSGSR